MAKTEIMNKLSRFGHRAGLKFKKHSPEILVVTGIVGTVVGAVMACKATLKVDEITSESKDKIEEIHEAAEKGVTTAGEEYTEQDSKKDLTIVYAQTGIKLAKLYAPAVGVTALSITAILAGHNITRKRYLASSAAYAAVSQSFKEYRGRVVDRFGKELDKELKYGIKAQEVEETVVDENGKEKKVKKTVEVVEDGLDKISPYAKFFDQSCTGWEKNPELNMLFLKQQERYANDRLKIKGHVFLNEVYDLLGIDRTSYGNIVGWIYDEKHPNGDNYIDFGIFNGHRQANRNFVNGLEPVILLDFNVDGDILNKI